MLKKLQRFQVLSSVQCGIGCNILNGEHCNNVEDVLIGHQQFVPAEESLTLEESFTKIPSELYFKVRVCRQILRVRRQIWRV